MIDSFKHKGQRKHLVALLQEKGIEDKKVLYAIEQIPRHLFIDSIFEEHAYEDKAFPILAKQTISHPYTVAFQTQLLQINQDDKILEIGTGSGYQTAVLVALKAEVYTIERQKELFDFSKKILKRIDFSPKHQSFGDGYKGLPSYAPFDKIIVTAGAPSVPKELLKQLKIGGIMIIPIGNKSQVMTSFLKISEDQFEKLEYGNYKFVPMLDNKEK